MNSAPNAKPTESDNVLIVSADKGREHPDREIAPAGQEPKAEDSKVEDLKAEVPKAEDPKAISGDAPIERADVEQARADEQIAANEQVTPSASDPKATEAANGLIEPADERLRETEQISEPEPDAAQDPLLVPSLVPSLVTSDPSAGRPALRGLIGLVSAASIFVAAFISQSSHIAAAKQTVARWVAQLGSTSSEPLNQSERRVSRVVSAAQVNAAESMASPPAPSPRTAPQEVAATASLSLDQAQMLQAIARDLAKLGQRVEELNTRQEQMAGASAKLDLAQLQAMAPDLAKLGQRLEEFNTRQEQMAGANAKAIEQLTASQDQLAENIKAIQQLEKTQEQVARDNAKTAEQIKAGRDQIARFLAARASEQNPQPRTSAPRPHPFAAPPR